MGIFTASCTVPCLQMSGHFISHSSVEAIYVASAFCIITTKCNKISYFYYNYVEHLNLLHLPRLELRRMQNDLIWRYKILFGHVKICSSNFFEFRLSSTHGHPYKLFKHHCSNTTRSVFFAECVINVWNSLPSDLVDFSTLKSFTRSLKAVDLSDYCNGSI